MEPRRAVLRVLDDTQPMKISAQDTRPTSGQAPALKLVETRPGQKEETSMTTTATTPTGPAPVPAVDTFADDTLERVRALLASFTPQQVEELKGILPGGATSAEKPTESRLMKVPTPVEAKALAPRMFATHWERPGRHIIPAQRLEGLSIEELTVLAHRQFTGLTNKWSAGAEQNLKALETAFEWFIWEEIPGKPYVTLTLTRDVVQHKHSTPAMLRLLERVRDEMEAYRSPARPAFIASHLVEVATRLEDYFTALPDTGHTTTIDGAGSAYDYYLKALAGREDPEYDWAPLENCPDLAHPLARRELIDAGLLAELKDDSGELTGFVFPLLVSEQA